MKVEGVLGGVTVKMMAWRGIHGWSGEAFGVFGTQIFARSRGISLAG